MGPKVNVALLLASRNRISYLNSSGCVLGGVASFHWTYMDVLVSGSAVKTTLPGIPSIRGRGARGERRKKHEGQIN